MLSSNSLKILQFFKQTRRVSGGLILNDSKEIAKKKAISLFNLKKVPKKKPRKKHVIVKRLSDDIEAVWLENLSSDNLKLYRKTSYGSFRKINLEKLLEKLREIYPSTLGNVNTAVKAATKEDCFQPQSSTVQPPKAEENPENVQAAPYMSEYLIKNIVDFPLLKAECDSSLTDFVKEETEDFGAVDSLMFPSVTGILGETMSDISRIKLKQWRDRMIAELGLKGFYKYQRDLLNEGSKFHATLKTYLEVADKRLVTVDPQIEGCWKSLANLLPDIADVRLVEESIYHPVLMYRGIVDCVATYRGTPCVIEWKKSNKIKSALSDTYDAPIQLCAYLGALPWHKNITVKNGLVVVAYTDGTPANVFEMTLESCEIYWIEWLRRLQTYWLKKSSTIVQEEN